MNKIIHHTAVGYLVIIMLVRMMAMPLTCIDYAINKSYIANAFCENKGRPEIQCFGKCYLSKQLSKTNDNQDSQNQKASIKLVIVDAFEEAPANVLCADKLFFSYPEYILQHIPSIFTGSIFHPPIAC